VKKGSLKEKSDHQKAMGTFEEKDVQRNLSNELAAVASPQNQFQDTQLDDSLPQDNLVGSVNWCGGKWEAELATLVKHEDPGSLVVYGGGFLLSVLPDRKLNHVPAKNQFPLRVVRDQALR